MTDENTTTNVTVITTTYNPHTRRTDVVRDGRWLGSFEGTPAGHEETLREMGVTESELMALSCGFTGVTPLED